MSAPEELWQQLAGNFSKTDGRPHIRVDGIDAFQSGGGDWIIMHCEPLHTLDCDEARDLGEWLIKTAGPAAHQIQPLIDWLEEQKKYHSDSEGKQP